MENFMEATYPRPGKLTPGALFRSLFESPFGMLNLAVDADGTLVELWLPNRKRRDVSPEPFPHTARAGMDAVRAQLREYFAGTRRAFDLPVQPSGSPFEQRVWARLREIPYGVTTSYGAIATEFGLINGARAVGRANGANPIPVIIPCHRVIGADGTLTGFGGGLPLKRALLELEGAIAPPEPMLF
jgi:methylated-DNA-[protein]-cysteine S-methyltransferase